MGYTNYIKLFKNKDEYDLFTKSSDIPKHNVSACVDSGEVFFNDMQKIEISNLCDIAYYDGKKIKTISKDKWNSSLGTPVGVVVIPSGFAIDGKARIVSLKYAKKDGSQSNTYVSLIWGNINNDTDLINYDRLPLTDNRGSTTTGSRHAGYLPSDKFSKYMCFLDNSVFYNTNTNMCQPPYKNNEINTQYYSDIYGYKNCFSDFNGIYNTEYLYHLGVNSTAAKACWLYSDKVSNTQWYLPAMGELGFLFTKIKKINETITFLGGAEIVDTLQYCSSSEMNPNSCYKINMSFGDVNGDYKNLTYAFRPFAIIN